MLRSVVHYKANVVSLKAQRGKKKKRSDQRHRSPRLAVIIFHTTNCAIRKKYHFSIFDPNLSKIDFKACENSSMTTSP
jgi:hypothetical protein